MKISEKAALAMAGYTKAEIEAMDKPTQPTPAAVQNPAIPQQVPPLAAPPAMQITQPAPPTQPAQPAQQPSGQYDGLEALLQQILQGQQSTTQAMQTMTQTMQANALGLGIQQQPAADASTVTARIIDPTYGQEVK